MEALVCPWQPSNFFSVSQGYLDFDQVSEARLSTFSPNRAEQLAILA